MITHVLYLHLLFSLANSILFFAVLSMLGDGVLVPIVFAPGPGSTAFWSVAQHERDLPGDRPIHYLWLIINIFPPPPPPPSHSFTCHGALRLIWLIDWLFDYYNFCCLTRHEWTTICIDCCQTHWARYGHTETEGEDATTTPAGINSVIVGSGDIRDGNDDTIGGSDSTSGHRNGDNSVGGRLATWPLDPLPFTGILVENRPMKLY